MLTKYLSQSTLSATTSMNCRYTQSNTAVCFCLLAIFTGSLKGQGKRLLFIANLSKCVAAENSYLSTSDWVIGYKIDADEV